MNPITGNLLTLFACVAAGCGGTLQQVPEVPVQDTSDWRVPAPEWELLHRELLRCRGDVQRLVRRYSAQHDTYATYNTIGSVVGVAGSSTAISGVLNVAGVDNPDVNKALGISGAVLAAVGPIVFSLLSHQDQPTETRANYERMSAAYANALHGRSSILYCQSLLARTPEVAFAYPSDAPEVQADRARFQENCAAYYTVPPARGEPAPEGRRDLASRQRLARQIIDPEYQLTRLTEQLRQKCSETLTETQALQNFQGNPTPTTKDPAAAKDVSAAK